MDNPIVSWLFETDAVRVCPEGQPFWYTSGKLGPFYINTQFLYGSEAAANALLSVIEEACAGDKLAFYGKVYGEIEKQLAACPIYHQLIDLMCEAARSMDVDFVSGGERRDFFFSMPVARRLGRAVLLIEHRVIERALRVGKVNDLRQIARLDGRAELDLSLRGQLAEQHAQERRLAGAVVAEQGDSLAAPHRQLHTGKQRRTGFSARPHQSGQRLRALRQESPHPVPS